MTPPGVGTEGAEGRKGPGGAREGAGRPPHEPTGEQRRQARTMATNGIPQTHIAAILGIGEATLRKHYAEELVLGMARGALWTSDRIRGLAEAGHWGALKQMASFYLDWNDRADPGAPARTARP